MNEIGRYRNEIKKLTLKNLVFVFKAQTKPFGLINYMKNQISFLLKVVYFRESLQKEIIGQQPPFVYLSPYPLQSATYILQNPVLYSASFYPFFM